MQYEVDRDDSPNGEPSLTDMTEKAIKMLQRSDNGYFLAVEGTWEYIFTSTHPLYA